ncbi:hypothetical protein [Streptomyces ziwulingensis]|uniref:Aminoglycoside phosphotransferase n=1 Tax=Streptomyces ziwulingensis TaxID=1045501 RepID=A0ABP9CKH6_9ACTN
MTTMTPLDHPDRLELGEGIRWVDSGLGAVFRARVRVPGLPTAAYRTTAA